MVTKEYRKFAEYYVKNFSVPVMQRILQLLDRYRCGQWLSPRVVHQAFSYISTGYIQFSKQEVVCWL